MPAENKIFLTDEYLPHDDALAAGAVTPGHLVEYASADGDTLDVHGTEEGPAQPVFADKDPTAGDMTDSTAPIDVAYAQDDAMYAGIAQRGCRVNALIAANEDLAVGDFVVSAGDGTLQEFDSATPDPAGVIIGVAVEAATAASVFRCEIEVL